MWAAFQSSIVFLKGGLPPIAAYLSATWPTFHPFLPSLLLYDRDEVAIRICPRIV